MPNTVKQSPAEITARRPSAARNITGVTINWQENGFECQTRCDRVFSVFGALMSAFKFTAAGNLFLIIEHINVSYCSGRIQISANILHHQKISLYTTWPKVCGQPRSHIFVVLGLFFMVWVSILSSKEQSQFNICGKD